MPATPAPIATQPVPHMMLELARLAIERGFDRVELGFGGLGSDFPAPIGWCLHLEPISYPYVNALEFHEREDDVAEIKNAGPIHLAIMMQVGDEEPAAYVHAEAGGPFTHWGAEQIRTWICAERRSALVLDDDARAACREHADRMLEAWSNGWVAGRTIDRTWSLMLGRSMLLPSVHQTFTARNYAYEIAGNPFGRGSGAPYSRELTFSRMGLTGEPFHQGAVVDHQLPLIPMEMIDILAEIAAPQPWYAPVATYDEDREEWLA